MHRIDGPGAVGSLPAVRESTLTPGYFSPGNPATGQQSTRVTYEWTNAVQEEIVNVVTAAGIQLDKTKNDQMLAALQALFLGVGTTFERYDLCEFYYFRHPLLKPGFQPAHGGLITDAATKYPDAWAYLQTTEGRMLCKLESEWQAMTKATWATLADGTKVGWNGIGGAPFYAPNFSTGVLRLPDLRGMYAEAAGFDGPLGVGGVHGDGGRRLYAEWTPPLHSTPSIPLIRPDGGAVVGKALLSQTITLGTIPSTLLETTGIDSSMTTPTANKNQPRAWGALACCYLGAPR